MKKLFFLLLLVSCKPFGADDNNGSVIFDPPTETFYTQSLSNYDLSTSAVSTLISPAFNSTESIVSCTGSNLPSTFILNPNCSINVVNLETPFDERTITLTGTTYTKKKHIKSFTIGAFTKNCANNSTTLTRSIPKGNGSSSNPYILCSKDHFLYYINTLNGNGYAILQKDIDLGSMSVGFSELINSNLNGLGHKLSYSINSSNQTTAEYNNLSLFDNIKNSIIKNLEISCVIYSPIRVSCLTKKLETTELSNLIINSNSLLTAQYAYTLGYESAIESLNKLENILIAPRINASSTYYSIFGLIDANDISSQVFSNILIFNNASTGTKSPILNSKFLEISAAQFNQSLENAALYSNFNNLYWTKSSNTQMSLKKEVYNVFE